MAAHMSKLRLQRALRNHVPPAAHISYQPGDRVLVWREKLLANRIGEWVGPYTISNVDESHKVAHIDNRHTEGNSKPFHYSQFKH